MNTQYTVSSRNFLIMIFFSLIASDSAFTFQPRNSLTNKKLQLRSMTPETRIPTTTYHRLTRRNLGPTPEPAPKDGSPPIKVPGSDLGLSGPGPKILPDDKLKSPPGKDLGLPPKSGPPSKLGPTPKPEPVLGSEISEITEKIETGTIRVGGKDCDKKKTNKSKRPPTKKIEDESETDSTGTTVIKIEVVAGGCSTCCKTCAPEEKLKEADGSPPAKTKAPVDPIPEKEPPKPKPVPEVTSGKGGDTPPPSLPPIKANSTLPSPSPNKPNNTSPTPPPDKKTPPSPPEPKPPTITSPSSDTPTPAIKPPAPSPSPKPPSLPPIPSPIPGSATMHIGLPGLVTISIGILLWTCLILN